MVVDGGGAFCGYEDDVFYRSEVARDVNFKGKLKSGKAFGSNRLL